ncbi:MAG: helix-turn-helix domain-containing protein [Methylobacteriaceae bacterium]|nr:helix-turn-helix domain-containing protein [Methylobacteriaceae bacterium]
MEHRQDKLRPVTFSTELVAPEHRFDAWRTALSSSHVLEAEPAGFFGRVRSVQIDRLLVHVLDSAPVALARSAKQTRQDGLDHVILHLSRHAIQARAGETDLAVAPGRISVNDLSRPTTRRAAPETESLVAILPRDLVREALGTSDDLHGRVLQGGAAPLLETHLAFLADRAAEIPASAGPDLARATAALLAAALAPSARTLARAEPAFEAAKAKRARAYIEAHLASDRLTPDAIGRAVGLSRSVLFRLFEPHGGVAAYIWGRRLAAVREALARPQEVRQIGEIGAAFGFASGAHLSRSFRRAYGQTPRDFRDAARR